MPIIDTKELEVGQPLPGWRDRYFHSEGMSFAYYDVKPGMPIHEHSHEEEEVWHIIEGTFDITIGGKKFVASPGMAAIVPSNTPHSVSARTTGKVIIANQPVRNRVIRHRLTAVG